MYETENVAKSAPGRTIGRVFVPNIILLGLTSLFIDMSSEMVYPMIPLYLASFGTAPAIIGLIEGIAESLASFMKVISGWLGDKYGVEKKLTVAGYGSSIIYKLLLLASTSWIGVLFARVTDRVGKGVRTAPRDSMIAASGNGKRLGRYFGMHKTMDMLGSSLGVLLAMLVIGVGMSFDMAFILSLIPAAIGFGIMMLVKNLRHIKKEKIGLAVGKIKLNPKLRAFLIIIFFFFTGNSSNAFLLLKAGESGLGATEVIFMYFIFSIAASILSYPLGRLSDRIGQMTLLVTGYALHGLVYFGLAWLDMPMALPVLFALYGVCTALTSAAERAFVVENTTPKQKGTVLGLYGMFQGFGLLAASILAGILWEMYGSDAPFVLGGVIGIISAVAILIVFHFVKDKKNGETAK